MFIELNGRQVELSTKLGTAIEIENQNGKMPLMKILQNLGEATIDELVKIICIAAKKAGQTVEIRNELFENFDLTDLFNTTQELIVKLMYSGTPEQNEAKLQKSPMRDEQKNAIRVLLGLKVVPLAKELSESATQSD